MDVENLSHVTKIGLTNADKADKIWEKLKAEAMVLGYGTMQLNVTIHNGLIIEIRQQSWEKIFRS